VTRRTEVPQCRSFYDRSHSNLGSHVEKQATNRLSCGAICMQCPSLVKQLLLFIQKFSQLQYTGPYVEWWYFSHVEEDWEIGINDVKFEFFTAVIMKNGVFWDLVLVEPTFRNNLAPPSSGWQESVNHTANVPEDGVIRVKIDFLWGAILKKK
jgi:hypothetical protein